MISVHLTDARVGALEQSGLDPRDPDALDLDHSADERVVMRAWRDGGPNRLTFADPEDAPVAAGVLTDLANAEDEQAERDGDPYARRARDVLTRLFVRLATLHDHQRRRRSR